MPSNNNKKKRPTHLDPTEAPITPLKQIQSSTQPTEHDIKLDRVRELKPRVFASSVASYVSFAVFIPTVIAAITLLAKNPSLFSSGIGNPEVVVLAVGAVALAALISGITSVVVCSKQFKSFKEARKGLAHKLFAADLSGSPFKPQKKLTPTQFAAGIILRNTHRQNSFLTNYSDNDSRSEISPSTPSLCIEEYESYDDADDIYNGSPTNFQ